MLPEDLPLTTAELKKLFHAAGYATHQKIADALKVEKTLVTKWLSRRAEAHLRQSGADSKPGACSRQ